MFAKCIQYCTRSLHTTTKWDLSQVCKAASAFENQLVQEEKITWLFQQIQKKFDKFFWSNLFDKSQYSFVIKTHSKLGIEGNLQLDTDQSTKKPTLTAYFCGEKLTGFPLRSRRRQRCPFSPLLSNTVLNILANAVRWDRVIKISRFGVKK